MTTLFNERNRIASQLLYLLMLFPFAAQSQQNPVSNPVLNTGIFCDASTTWNGVSWSNGQPGEGKDAIINANFTFSGGTFYACSLTVLSGAHVNFTQNSNAIIVHNINVALNAELVFESGSNLIQTEAEENSGNVIIKRNSSLIKKDAYTLWASPVSDQLLLDFSPETLLNRFYTFSTTDNIYTTVASPAISAFETARGYLIRTGENHPLTPTVWEANFEGTPNTGDITFPLVYVSNNQSYNAVGNPYPSPISIARFLDINSDAINGTIWLWRKTDNLAQSSYSVVTKFGFLANMNPDDENNTIQNPYDAHEEGVINTAQGFIVKAEGNENLVFNNDMRLAVSSQSFFRTDGQKDGNIETSRFWLNITGENIFSQVLIGYTGEATIGYDKGFDGEAMMDGTTTLYSIADGKKLAIQARPEFEDTDIVSLGFKTATAGTFTFALNNMDGLFAVGQHIYIKDIFTNILHDLNSGSYSFTSTAGTFENRFIIVYSENIMGTDGPSADKNTIVYSNDSRLKIQSSEEIASVFIYDMLGRAIFEKSGLTSTEFSSTPINADIVVIARVTLNNGAVVTKKIFIQ